MPSHELAERLSIVIGRPLSAGAVRQALQRSRRKYVNYLVDRSPGQPGDPTRDDLEEELSDLHLLEYCRPYMKSRDDPA